MEKITEEQLIDIIKEEFKLSTVEKKDTFDILQLDDVDKEDLALRLEEEFSISIEEEICSNWTSVSDVLNYLKEQDLILE